MSIRHVIAGVVLVVVGGIVVNAYQDEPKPRNEPSEESLAIDLQIRELQLQQEKLALQLKHALWERERQKALRSGIGGLLTTGTLVLADDPQPAPRDEARPATSPYLAGDASSGVGRFRLQVIPTSQGDMPRSLLLDTATGHCWILSNWANWYDIGSPFNPVTPAKDLTPDATKLPPEVQPELDRKLLERATTGKSTRPDEITPTPEPSDRSDRRPLKPPSPRP